MLARINPNGRGPIAYFGGFFFLLGTEVTSYRRHIWVTKGHTSVQPGMDVHSGAALL